MKKLAIIVLAISAFPVSPLYGLEWTTEIVQIRRLDFAVVVADIRKAHIIRYN